MTSGSPAVVYRYDIYGKTHATNDDVNNPYQYNAEYTDSTTGLQYLRARYYNADTHRFQTKDTYQGNVAQPITRNSYAYANNNPVNFVDPSGHSFLAAVITVAVVAVVAITTPFVVKNAKQTVDNSKATYEAQSKAILEQLNDIERTQTKSKNTYGDTVWGAVNRAWNKDHRSEFEDDAAYDQYVRLCDELEKLQKETKGDIWHANLDVAGIILDFADVANAALYAIEGDYDNAVKSGLYSVPSLGGAAAGVLKYSDEVAEAAKAAENAGDASETVAKTTKTYNWGNINTLDDHFVRHGSDVGATTAEDYAKIANDFYNNRNNYQVKVADNGVVRVYDPVKNIFGSYNPDGRTKTLFSPDKGQAYFDAQPGTLLR